MNIKHPLEISSLISCLPCGTKILVKNTDNTLFVAVDGMNEYFKSTGVEIDVEKGTGEDEEMVSGYFASSGSSETVAIVHLNQDDVVFTSGRYLVYVTGSVRLYDRNGNLTDETDSLGAVGEGASLPVALSEAFRQAGVNASMLLLSFL